MTNGKKDILIIMGRYLPGYKDGGPVRSIKNLVDYLGDEYNFKILTCDRDHGDEQQYPDIKVNDWNKVGKANVYYVAPGGFNKSVIKKLANESDLVYCCGCFNDYAINTLVLNRFKQLKVPVVVAAMGLFSPMEFRLKYAKKKLFTTVFNLTGMFKNIYWSATSQMEIDEIKQQVKCNDNFFIAEDLPRKVDKTSIVKDKEIGRLKVVWISRIAPKKNLKGAIAILQEVKSNIEFTIYGPIHDEEYWNECLTELNKLPSNIKWSWKGNIESDSVVEKLKKHHVFLFPTLGENYGHVIQEALSSGCPVVLSDQTPWKNIEKNNAGYAYSIEREDDFVKLIEYYSYMNNKQFQECINASLAYAITNSNQKIENTGYRQIFNYF